MMHLRLKAVVCTGLNVHTAKLEVCVCVWRGWGDSFVSENGLKFLMQFNWSGEKRRRIARRGVPWHSPT